MPTIFISHIYEERGLASILKAHIHKDFLGAAKTFVSSDIESVLAGTNWLHAIERALRKADVMILCCSTLSVKRPWINFETGAAWMRKIPLIPLCHSGLEPRNLPMPMAVLQAVRAGDPAGVEAIYRAISVKFAQTAPAAPFVEIAAEIRGFESRFSKELPPGSGTALAREAEIMFRMMRGLEDPRWRWRTIERLAAEAACSVAEASDVLRGNPDVVLGSNNRHVPLARLRWR